MREKYQKIVLKIFKKDRNLRLNQKLKTQTFLGLKNFKRLLISMPKFMKLNSELILVLGFGLGPQPGPRLNIYFFWG
jgi:hypothetical protein